MRSSSTGTRPGIRHSPRSMRMRVRLSQVPCIPPTHSFCSAFYRQSLQIQQIHAELYHSATALRGINGPEDVQKMHASQREVAIKSMQIARQGLDITVKSHSYREGMKYGGFPSAEMHLVSGSLTHHSRPLYPCHRNVRCLFPSSPFAVIVSTFLALNRNGS